MINWKYFGRVHASVQMEWRPLRRANGLDQCGAGDDYRAQDRQTAHGADRVTLPRLGGGFGVQQRHGTTSGLVPEHAGQSPVTVQLGKERFEAVAEEVAAQEREALWASVVKINKHQGEYLDRVEREIPLVWFRRLQHR